ncbi:MAG: iron ABC transporter permease, partial [Cytophagaceae bacterium]|nr:iron ABC transporter permease [Cytophagaceae bacterium]
MRSLIIILLSFTAFIILLFLGLQTGGFKIDSQIIVDSIFNYNAANNLHYIIINLRLPRILLAFLVGGALAFSGYIMQAMVNNPLADPFILGTASGASLGASMCYLFFPLGLGVLLPSFMAFAGAMIVTLIACIIAYQRKHLAPSKLLLSGIALSSLTVSIISLMIFFSGDESKLKTIIFWSMGGFELAKWEYIPLLFFSLLL